MMSGFNSASPVAVDNDLTEEEQELMRLAEEANQERKRQLFDKQNTEGRDKQERKVKAEQELAKLKAERDGQITGRRETNQQHEQQFYALREEQRKGGNPWERVNENCDFSTSSSAAGKDMSRMRAVMLSRKGDITKAGGVKAKEQMF